MEQPEANNRKALYWATISLEDIVEWSGAEAIPPETSKQKYNLEWRGGYDIDFGRSYLESRVKKYVNDSTLDRLPWSDRHILVSGELPRSHFKANMYEEMTYSLIQPANFSMLKVEVALNKKVMQYPLSFNEWLKSIQLIPKPKIEREVKAA